METEAEAGEDEDEDRLMLFLGGRETWRKREG